MDYIVPGSGGIQVLHAGTDADEQYLQGWIGAHQSVRDYIDSQHGIGDDYVQQLRNLTIEIFLIPTPGVTLFFDPDRAKVQTFNTADGSAHDMPPCFSDPNHSGSIVLSDGTRIDIMQGIGITLVSGNQIITTVPPPDPPPANMPEPQADEFGPYGVQFYTYSSTNPIVVQAYVIKTSIHPLATSVLATFDGTVQYAFTNGFSDDGTQAWSISAQHPWNIGDAQCAWLNVPNASENNAVSRALYTVNPGSLGTWAPANPGTGWTNANLDWHRDTESQRVANWFKSHLTDILLTIGGAILTLLLPGIGGIIAGTFRTVLSAVRGGMAAERAVQTAATAAKIGDEVANVANGAKAVGAVAGTGARAAGTVAVDAATGVAADGVKTAAQVAVRNTIIDGAETKVTTALVQKASLLQKIKGFSWSDAINAGRITKTGQVEKYTIKWQDYNRVKLATKKPNYKEAEATLRQSIKANPALTNLKEGTKAFDQYIKKVARHNAQKAALADADKLAKSLSGKAVRRSNIVGKRVKYKVLGERSNMVLMRKAGITMGTDMAISILFTVITSTVMAAIAKGKHPTTYYDMDQYGHDGFQYDVDSSDGSENSSDMYDEDSSDDSSDWTDSSGWEDEDSSNDAAEVNEDGSSDLESSNADDASGEGSEDLTSDNGLNEDGDKNQTDTGVVDTLSKSSSNHPSKTASETVTTSCTSSLAVATASHHAKTTVTVHVPYSSAGTHSPLPTETSQRAKVTVTAHVPYPTSRLPGSRFSTSTLSSASRLITTATSPRTSSIHISSSRLMPTSAIEPLAHHFLS